MLVRPRSQNPWQLASPSQGCGLPAPPLDAVGEELAVIPIDLIRGDSKEGRKEVRVYRLLQWLEERGSVGDYSLDILPFVLQQKVKPAYAV